VLFVFIEKKSQVIVRYRNPFIILIQNIFTCDYFYYDFFIPRLNLLFNSLVDPRTTTSCWPKVPATTNFSAVGRFYFGIMMSHYAVTTKYIKPTKPNVFIFFIYFLSF
jgi:hypothetical protein